MQIHGKNTITASKKTVKLQEYNKIDIITCTTSNGEDETIVWSSSTKIKKNYTSLPKFIEENDDLLRSKYLKYIQEINNTEIKGKKILEILKLRKNFSYWWMTLLAEKANIEKSVYINDILKLLALEIIINKKNIKKISISCSNKKIINILKHFCFKKNIEFSFKKNLNKIQKRKFNKFLPNTFKSILWIVFYSFSIWPLRGLGLKKIYSNLNEITIFNYFTNFKYINDQYFYSNYWTNLIDNFHKKNLNINWVHLYFRFNKKNNVFKNKKIVKEINKKSYDNHVFLESFISLKLILKIIIDWIKIYKNTKKIIIIKNNYKVTELDLFILLKEDWLNSIRGTVLINNLINFNLFEELLNKTKNHKFGLYAQENQSWEFGLLYLWQKNNHSSLIGYQQSTVRFWDLRNFYSKESYDKKGIEKFPMPNYLAINNEIAYNYFIKQGYPKEKLVKVEALRYLNLKEKIIKKSFQKSSNLKILIILEGLEKFDKFFVNCFIKIANSFSKNFKFIIKSHSLIGAKFNLSTSENIFYSKENLYKLINDCDLVLVANSSSTSSEVIYFNKPFFILLDPIRPNLNPLRDYMKINLIENIDILEEILKNLENNLQILNYDNEYFYTDKNLKKWDDLTKKLLS